MDISYSFFLVVLMWMDVATANEEETIKFDECYRSIDYVTEEKRFLIEWDGYIQDHINSCKQTLHGYDKSNVLDEYKVCIKTKSFNVQDYDIVLKYYSAKTVLQDNLKGTYSVTSPPPNEWCSEPEEYVDIHLYNPNTISGQKIVLEVYGKKTYDYSKVLTAIVAGVLGGLALIGIIVTIIVCVLVRRKRQGSPGMVLSNQGTGANQMVPQAGGQPMGGGNYATTYSNASAPPPNYYSATSGN